MILSALTEPKINFVSAATSTRHFSAVARIDIRGVAEDDKN